MRKSVVLLFTLLICAMTFAQNPFLKKSKTPHGTFPFNELKNEHFMPAVKEGIKQHSAEINKIANNKQAPTFQNTIEAMERSGELLGNVITVFYALNSAETNETMQALAQEISPMLTDHSNSINLNEKLFNRVKAVYDQRNSLNLNPEQAQLLKKTYDSFANNGANLSAEDKEKYRELSKELSLATLQYGQNSLKETNAYSDRKSVV